MAAADTTPEVASGPGFEHRIQRRVGAALSAAFGVIAIINVASIASVGVAASQAASNALTLAALAGVSLFTAGRERRTSKLIQVGLLATASVMAVLLNDPSALEGPAFAVLTVLLAKQYGFLQRHLAVKLGAVLGAVVAIGAMRVVGVAAAVCAVFDEAAVVAFATFYLFIVWVIFAEEKKHYVALTRELVDERSRNEVFVYFGKNVAGFAHNMRNVLTILAGYNAQLKGARDLAEVKDISGYEYAAIRRLADTIEHMMTVTKAKQDTRRIQLDVNSLLQGIIEFFNTDLNFKRRVRVQLDLQEQHLFAVVVPSQLAASIENLIRNAYEAIPEGDNTVARISIGTSRMGRLATIRIADDGVGRAGPATLENEECFSHFAVGRTSKERGTGLGLLSVLDACADNSWGVRFSSEVGVGTDVQLTLGLTDASPAHIWPRSEARDSA